MDVDWSSIDFQSEKLAIKAKYLKLNKMLKYFKSYPEYPEETECFDVYIFKTALQLWNVHANKHTEEKWTISVIAFTQLLETWRIKGHPLLTQS